MSREHCDGRVGVEAFLFPRSRSVIVEFVVCVGGDALWGPATQMCFFPPRQS